MGIDGTGLMPARSHGYSGRVRHPMYRVWSAMLARCNNPNDPRFKTYGARGVRVCLQWHTFARFMEDLIAEIGPRPAGVGKGGRSLYSLDRKDNERGYEPGNVKWSTSVEQGQNTTATVRYRYKGEELTLREWARRLHLPFTLIRGRVDTLGWSVARAFETPHRWKSKQ
jgi:hypothetical protein